ncbi:response regulator [Nostoc sp. UHCC 0926]|uniref:response regulator n=1 Tax=unclassified Nostoc TaxID=2593658 RepID=UPI002360F4E7|nr:response regulator [Nostoc sp. UHCC 0926]WDD30231.1 response regulator [Nostoc sp. UHCC 0926]
MKEQVTSHSLRLAVNGAIEMVQLHIELHGGVVWAESPGEGLGATFTVRLPLMPIQPGLKADLNLSKRSPNLSGVRVLVVEDEADSKEFIALALEQAGASVITAPTADEAFTLLTQSQIDILLSDIGMADMDGYMLVRQIRALSPEQGGNVPAIALTAYAGDFNQQQAFRCICRNRLIQSSSSRRSLK